MHFKLLEAYESAFQDGVAPTDTVIAKKLSVRRETVCRWRRRNPDLVTWIYDQIGRAVAERRPFVDRRVIYLAEAGSPEHAKLYYAFIAKVGGDPFVASGGPTFVINKLIPRPEPLLVADRPTGKRT